MKKAIISAAFIAALLLTACGSDDKSESVTEAETTVSVTEAPSETEAVSEETASDEAETSGEVSEEITEDEGDIIEDETAENPDGVFGEVSDNPLMPMVERVTTDKEWPFMMEVTDETIIKEFFTLDPSNETYTQMIVMQCPMSATMSEIIIINTTDVDAAVEALGARKTKAIEVDAWYPNDKVLAEESIVGSYNSYAYFLIGAEAAEGEKSIQSYIDENGL